MRAIVDSMLALPVVSFRIAALALVA